MSFVLHPFGAQWCYYNNRIREDYSVSVEVFVILLI